MILNMDHSYLSRKKKTSETKGNPCTESIIVVLANTLSMPINNNYCSRAKPPKGQAPTMEEISLLESVDINHSTYRRRWGDRGGCPDRHGRVRDGPSHRFIVRDGGAGRLARCLANMPDKQMAALLATESLGQKTYYLGRLCILGCPSKHAEG